MSPCQVLGGTKAVTVCAAPTPSSACCPPIVTLMGLFRYGVMFTLIEPVPAFTCVKSMAPDVVWPLTIQATSTAPMTSCPLSSNLATRV